MERRKIRGGGRPVVLTRRWFWIPALLAGGAALVLLLIGRGVEWPGSADIEVVNAGNEPMLVDARWWGGPARVVGPFARLLEPDSAMVIRPGGRGDLCIRAIEPGSGRIARVLVPARDRNDVLRVDIPSAPAGPPGPELPVVCPGFLEDDRVRVGWGRYLQPGNPPRVRRERIIRRF